MYHRKSFFLRDILLKHMNQKNRKIYRNETKAKDRKVCVLRPSLLGHQKVYSLMIIDNIIRVAAALGQISAGSLFSIKPLTQKYLRKCSREFLRFFRPIVVTVWQHPGKMQARSQQGGRWGGSLPPVLPWIMPPLWPIVPKCGSTCDPRYSRYSGRLH